MTEQFNDSIETTTNESNAVKMIMVFEDGTTKEFTKGFIVESTVEEDEYLTVRMHGCNISGKELINTAVTIMTPILQQAIGDMDEDEE